MSVILPSSAPAPSHRHQAVYARQRHGQVPAPLRAIVWSSFGEAALHVANPDIPSERALIDMVVSVCESKHIAQVPPVYIANTSILNAASVSGQGLVYTTAILKAMNHDQLAAITGHELSHHRHSGRDMLMMGGLGIAGAIITRVALGLASHTALSSESGALQRTGAALEWLDRTHLPEYLGLMAAVTPWRHYMELEADTEGAQATTPATMKSALERLVHESEKPKTHVTERSLLSRIVRAALNPFPSHPSTDHRMARMDAMEQGR